MNFHIGLLFILFAFAKNPARRPTFGFHPAFRLKVHLEGSICKSMISIPPHLGLLGVWESADCEIRRLNIPHTPLIPLRAKRHRTYKATRISHLLIVVSLSQRKFLFALHSHIFIFPSFYLPNYTMKLSIAILTAFLGFSMAVAVPNTKDVSEQAVPNSKLSLVTRDVYCPSNKPQNCCAVSWDTH